jgi:hypothetical protein
MNEITHDQVLKALEQYRRISLEQALWAVFGETSWRDTEAARGYMEEGMRKALQRVAEARRDRRLVELVVRLIRSQTE